MTTSCGSSTRRSPTAAGATSGRRLLRPSPRDAALWGLRFQRTVHSYRAERAGCHRPPWRLLVESPEPCAAIATFDAFRWAGFDVAVCGGPAADAGDCPVGRGEPCPLVDLADVVLFDVDSDPPMRSRVLAAMRKSRPRLPIVVRSTAPTLATAGCATIRPTTSVSAQALALRKSVLQWPSWRV